MTPPNSLKFRLALQGWQTGKTTIRQLELLVKSQWLTREEVDIIYTYQRPESISSTDPYSADIVAEIRRELNR